MAEEQTDNTTAEEREGWYFTWGGRVYCREPGRWRKAALVGVLVAVISPLPLTYLLFEPVYEATAQIQIEERRPYIAFPDKDASRAFIATQVELIRNPLVFGPVLSRPEIARIPELQNREDPLLWLRENLKVAQVGASKFFNVSYAGPDPEDAAKIVNAVVGEYFNLRGKTEAERTQRVIELPGEERERRATEISQLREKVRTLAKQATGKDPFAANSEVDMVVRPAPADLQGRLTDAEVEQEILKARIVALEETSKRPSESSHVHKRHQPAVSQAVAPIRGCAGSRGTKERGPPLVESTVAGYTQDARFRGKREVRDQQGKQWRT